MLSYQIFYEKGLNVINHYSEVIDFGRENLTSVDVIFWPHLTSKVDPRTERIKIFIVAADPWHRDVNNGI